MAPSNRSISEIRFVILLFSSSKSTNPCSGMYISIPVTTDVADCFGLTMSVPDEIFSTLASDFTKSSWRFKNSDCCIVHLTKRLERLPGDTFIRLRIDRIEVINSFRKSISSSAIGSVIFSL